MVRISTSCLPSTLHPTRLRQRTNGFARRSPFSPIQNLIANVVIVILMISVPVPDGEVPNGEHPVHIDLKVLGVEPVSLARLDLRIIIVTISIALLSLTCCMKPSMGQLYLNSTSEVDGATISSEDELNESTLLVFLPAMKQ